MLESVIGRVLHAEILGGGRESNRRVPFRVERSVVAATAKPVATEDEIDAHLRQVPLSDLFDVARQGP